MIMTEPVNSGSTFFNRIVLLFAILQKFKYLFCEIGFECINRLWAIEIMIYRCFTVYLYHGVSDYSYR